MEDRENFEISTRGLKARCSASELPIQGMVGDGRVEQLSRGTRFYRPLAGTAGFHRPLLSLCARLDPGPGFEPGLTASKAVVLPLDDPGAVAFGECGAPSRTRTCTGPLRRREPFPVVRWAQELVPPGGFEPPPFCLKGRYPSDRRWRHAWSGVSGLNRSERPR